MAKLDFYAIYREKCYNRGVCHFELKRFDVIVTCTLSDKITWRPIQPMLNKNSAEVDIAPASGKVNRPCNIVQGQGACLKGMSRTITVQGFRLAAISDVEKTKL